MKQANEERIEEIFNDLSSKKEELIGRELSRHWYDNLYEQAKDIERQEREKSAQDARNYKNAKDGINF